MSEVLPPLVSADVDLRDFAFMPLDVVRLRDSGLTAKATGDEFRAAVLLWCASWHQQPAASLPNDDAELANLCGYARAIREWMKVKRGALRGWIECSDGRLYHPTVAAKANDAWESKLVQRARTESARRAREVKRQTLSQPLLQTDESSVTENVTSNVTASKGQGQGQGKKKDTRSASPIASAADLVAKGVDPKHAAEWLAIRKTKRLPLTGTALEDTEREARKAGLTLAQAVHTAVLNSWAGFKAAWYANADHGAGKLNGASRGLLGDQPEQARTSNAAEHGL